MIILEKQKEILKGKVSPYYVIFKSLNDEYFLNKSSFDKIDLKIKTNKDSLEIVGPRENQIETL